MDVEAVRAALAAVSAPWGERGDAVLDSGRSYRPGEPVTIEVRKRGRRYHLGDGGRATTLAGKPAGWLAAAERVVAREGFNLNRAGVVFVPAVEGSCGDLGLLAARLAEASHAVFAELVELG